MKLALFDGGSEGEDLFCVQRAPSELHFFKKSIFPGKAPFFALTGPSYYVVARPSYVARGSTSRPRALCVPTLGK